MRPPHYHTCSIHTNPNTDERPNIEAAIWDLLIRDGRVVTQPADRCQSVLRGLGFTPSQIRRGMDKLGVVSLPALCLINTEYAKVRWWWWAPDGFDPIDGRRV